MKPNSEQGNNSAHRRDTQPADSKSPAITAISLPTGGGAIRGMGEKFAANPATGTGLFSIPIYTSQGRAGFGPHLTLSYDSASGNGPFGLGWSLALPSITRKTDKGLPRYRDSEESDVFMLSGTEDLVPVMVEADGKWSREEVAPRTLHSKTYSITRYRPRLEGGFGRIERWTNQQDPSDSFWRAIDRNNTTTVYGATENSRIVDPADLSRIFSWLVCETYDDKGNVVHYHYKNEDSTGVSLSNVHERNRTVQSRSANRYPKSIKYGNRTPYFPQFDPVAPATPLPAEWLFEVVFDYGEHDPDVPLPLDVGQWTCRQDPFSTYRAGFEVRTYRLCERVLMFHHFPGEDGVGQDCLVRSTNLTYSHEKEPADPRNPISSFLVSTSQSGYQRDNSGYLRKDTPPVDLEYSKPVVQSEVVQLDAESLENLPAGLHDHNSQWVDLDSEGLPGILTEYSGEWFYKRNLSPLTSTNVAGHTRLTAKFGPLEKVALQPSTSNLAKGQQLIDLAGDGDLDLVDFDGPTPGFYERVRDGNWSSFTTFKSLPNLNWEDQNLRFIDLTGDGAADVLIAEENAFTWYLSAREEGYEPGEKVTHALDEEKGPRLVFSDGVESIFLADMSGDGLNDLVRIRNGEIAYWPNLGYGRFGAKVSMDAAPVFDSAEQFDQRRIRVADIDGSGLADIIYIHRDGLQLYFNQAGNSWGARQSLPVFPQVDNLSAVSVVDLLGNGTACVVWSSRLPGQAFSSLRYVDLVGGEKPNLLVRTVNNLGAETVARYASSTKFYLADKFAGKPWVTKIPFPVHVLERLETFDHISGTRFVNEYSYHHGYFDGVEREFRGFGMVEQTDTEAFEDYVVGVTQFDGEQELAPELFQPPVVTRTWFHTGAYLDRERIVHQFRDEYYLKQSHTPEPTLPDGLTIDELQECLRALKGVPLRQEVYSFDGTSQEQHPYTVTESNYDVRLVQPRGTQRHAVFLPKSTESITLNYERNADDPRITHALNLERDKYGNTIKGCSIVYGRKIADPNLPDAVVDAQQWTYVTYSESDYTTDIDEQTPVPIYRLRVPCDERSYEITGISPAGDLYTIDELKTKIAAIADDLSYEEPASGLIAEKRLLGQRRTLFAGEDLAPLGLGTPSPLGLLHQTFELAFTPGVVALYPPGQVSDADFVAAGYVHFDGDENWWLPSSTLIFPPNPASHFYQPLGTKLPLGLETVATLDKYDLLPEQVQAVQAPWNVTSAVNDYRVLGPVLTMDANKNRAAVEIDPLGLVVKSAVMGKAGSGEGDTLDDPTLRMEYDLFNWLNNRKPNFVHTFAREQHGPANPRWQESYAYTNGSGSVVLIKAQAHPGKALQVNPDGSVSEIDANPRWVGNGRIIQNNKGNPVKQYQPYFSTTEEYEDEKALGMIGTTPILYYDALGRNIRTDYADGTHERAEFNPWLRRNFDANDTVKQSQWYVDRGSPDPAAAEPLNDPERRAAWLAAKHAGTPATVHFDSLARSIYTIADYGGGKTAPLRSEMDLTGRTAKLFDQHGREVSNGFLTMIGTPLVSESSEKGRRWIFQNVLGGLVKAWDEHGRSFRAEYDILNRPVSTFVTEAGQPEVLFNYIVYGERADAPEQHNLLGMAHQIFDQAGVVQVQEIDFKGNSTLVERVLAKEYKQTIDWAALKTQPDYASVQAAADPLLETAEVFTAESEFDALNRPTRVVLPDETVIVPVYNEANFATSLSAQIQGQGNFIEFLKDQDYEANGQRKFSHFGNDLLIEYFHDPASFRLTKLLTFKTGTDPATTSLQDLNYTYDPVGNVTTLRDLAQQTHYFNNAVVAAENNFEFDAIYQLVRATGREHAGGGNDSLRTHADLDFVPQLPHANNLAAVRTYTEEYEYDLLGNIKVFKHRFAPQPGIGNGWTRHYRYHYEIDPDDRTNRLAATSQPGDPDAGPFTATYDHDVFGNMTRMPHLAVLDWNFMDQLRHVDLGGGGDAFYVYDSGQQRMRKVIERQNGLRVERIYLGALEIYRERQNNAAPHFERYSFTIADSSGRIAQIDTKTIDDNSIDPDNALNVPVIRYQHTNVLGSATLETDVNGVAISYEEFHPFGTSAYRSSKPGVNLSLKRYRFTGKELDSETGLYYFGVRFYAPWLARWTSSDPGGTGDGPNTFVYCRNSPVNQTDPFGLQTVSIENPVLVLEKHFTGKETFAELKALPVPEGWKFNPGITEKNYKDYWIPGPEEEGAGGSWVLLLPDGAEHLDFEVEGEAGPATAPQPATPPPQQPVAPPSPQPQQQSGTGAAPASGGEGGGEETKKERSFFTSSFFKGLVVGVAVTVAVVAVVATGGAALAVIAPGAYAAIAGSAAVGTGLAIAGGAGLAVGAAGIVQSVRQRDLWNNPISEEQANYNLGFGIGSIAGGALAKPAAGAGTALGSRLGQGAVQSGEALAQMAQGGEQLALAGGGTFGGGVAIAAPGAAQLGSTTAVTVATAGIGPTTMMMAGHEADWTLREPGGKLVSKGHTKSGSDVPPGRRLTWNEQLAVHTERKILAALGGKVKPGQVIRIRGTKPPCDPGGRGCASAMRDFATKYQVTIKYTNTTTGKVYTYP